MDVLSNMKGLLGLCVVDVRCIFAVKFHTPRYVEDSIFYELSTRKLLEPLIFVQTVVLRRRNVLPCDVGLTLRSRTLATTSWLGLDSGFGTPRIPPLTVI